MERGIKPQIYALASGPTMIIGFGKWAVPTMDFPYVPNGENQRDANLKVALQEKSILMSIDNLGVSNQRATEFTKPGSQEPPKFRESCVIKS